MDVIFHRPARTYPEAPPSQEVVIVAPPMLASAAGAASSWLQFLVPIVGTAGALVFVVLYHNPLMLIIAGVTTALSVGLGIAMRLQQVLSGRSRRKADRARYLRYLAQQEAILQKVTAAQETHDARLYPDLQQLWSGVMHRQHLWERRPDDQDFLHVRIGLGPKPLACPVRLELGQNPLVEYEPEQLAQAQALVTRYARLPWAPVVIPLRTAGTVGLIGHRPSIRALLRAMLCHLAADHAPEDVRIMAYFPEEAAADWDWLKWLPHARAYRATRTADEGDPDLTCLLADGVADLHSMLEAEVKPRIDQLRRQAESPNAGSVQVAASHLVLVIDGYSPRAAVARLPLVEELLRRAPELQVTVLCAVTEPRDEPSRMSARIEVGDTGHLAYEVSGPGGLRQPKVLADTVVVELCDSMARAMAPLRLEERHEQRELSEHVRLLELLGLPSADGLDPRQSWQHADPSSLLRVPIGVRVDGEPLHLDLKEAAHGGMGPHGLIVGATGSGKSELLRTIVSGLACTHAPDQLSFVFVDFKGGAAFADLAALPHAAGMITNLQSDLTMVDRMRAALFGEQERRQRLLREAGNLDSIREYQARRAQDPSREPMPYLLIVVDEFGELLANRPDFLELFVALGRVGRSLGMHLLLATQRLDEGRIRGLEGHLRYRICLRTFSAGESSAVLGTPDAYYLPPFPGVGYCKVDTSLHRFKTALISTPHRQRRRRPGAQTAIRTFTPIGREGPLRSGPPVSDPTGLERVRTEMEVVVERLREAGARPAHQVWLPPLEPILTMDRLLPDQPDGGLKVPVGLVDLPAQQAQEPLVLDFSGTAGHLAIVGAPQTGKSTLLRTILAAFVRTHSPRQAQFYAIDLGGSGLHRFEGTPYVGAVGGKLEPEKVRRIVREMHALIEEREQLFRDRGIDSMATFRRLTSTGDAAPRTADVFLVIDNWALLHQEFEGIDAEVAEVAATGLHYGVHVILTANRWADIRSSLRDNIGSRLELRLNDPGESDVGRPLAQGLPPNLPGRGLTQAGMQFQAALPRVDGRTESAHLQEAFTELMDEARRDAAGGAAPPIRMLPALVRAADLSQPDEDRQPGVPIGLEEHHLDPVCVDLLGPDGHFLVLGDGESGKTSLLRALVEGLKSRYTPAQVQLLLVDYRRTLLDVAEGPHIAAYALAAPMAAEAFGKIREVLAARIPSPSTPREALITRSWWQGPHYIVVVDDYDLVLSPSGNPVGALAEWLPQGRDIGLHLVLARRVAGTARSAFEPVYQRIRELGVPGLILGGDPQEGVLLGSQRASTLAPGRGYLVRPHRRTVLVQVVYVPPARADAA